MTLCVPTRKRQLQDLLSRYGKNEAIMLFGHNPSITEFAVHLLTGSQSRECMEFKKGAVVKLEVERGSGKLHWMLTPKLARVLRTRFGQKLTENVAKVVFFLLHRPEFQFDAFRRLRRKQQHDLLAIRGLDAHIAYRAASSLVECTRQPQ